MSLKYISLFIVFSLSVCLMVSCSNTVSPISEKSDKKSDQIEEVEEIEQIQMKDFEPAKEVEGMLTEGPGKYAGERYDKKKLEEEIKQFSNNLTAQEAYKKLLQLLAEDYEPIDKKYKNFDLTYYNPNADKTPNGTDDKGSDNKSDKSAQVSILIDASGSMAGKVNGQTKMKLAKEAAERFASSLPQNVKVSVVTYGHKGSNREQDKKVSCNSTEEIYPLSEYNEAKFNKALNNVNPTGWTPIASAIEKTHQSLQQNTSADTENVVFIISDGIETCDGNPVDAAKSLHQSNIQAVVNIVGFDVDNEAQQELKKIADIGGGEYETAKSAEDLNSYFNKKNTELILAWSKWWAKSFQEITKMHGEKWSALKKISPEFREQILMEKTRLDIALSQMRIDKKVSLESGNELQRLIQTRYSKLQKYNVDQYDFNFYFIVWNYNQMKREIKKIENENIEKIS
ncbi:VWA domain-containing protein [Mechercharimyces sp. CAU 1602]|uniref:vWA domain-containing protein n=1 Tax=Mechercharimyces sp. CAU 1602 TaxID=2973933 RepID=UPI002163C7CD|nr:VWA domain-containing protein [Mechercharimyces sp. CAU 1602]MCS1352446.1 VWA domain-containing protein [Mechercharimyces sp. CAU 1602]